MEINTNMFGDKEMMTDALSAQKFITDNYNIWANECATQQIKSELMNILNEEHQIQMELFTEMSKRGWYPVQAAQQPQIDQVKQKYPPQVQ
ncbi:spore coat protein [Candidatus Soleaferrea massiliensis]|uniref:spore coat protein n=1 Tax=Candidatus Soleaferrea massiliensis TaxID=1470354 RepID=UPI0005908F9C|nr:spore coat protein [Candidatus Soleaferrea massiliensis]